MRQWSNRWSAPPGRGPGNGVGWLVLGTLLLAVHGAMHFIDDPVGGGWGPLVAGWAALLAGANERRCRE